MESENLFRHEADECGNHHFIKQEADTTASSSSGGGLWAFIKTAAILFLVTYVIKAVGGMFSRMSQPSQTIYVKRPSIWPDILVGLGYGLATLLIVCIIIVQTKKAIRQKDQYWLARVAKWIWQAARGLAYRLHISKEVRMAIRNAAWSVVLWIWQQLKKLPAYSWHQSGSIRASQAESDINQGQSAVSQAPGMDGPVISPKLIQICHSLQDTKVEESDINQGQSITHQGKVHLN